MTIHQYKIYDRKLTHHELTEFEEKEKAYRREHGYPTMIKKTEIEKAGIGYLKSVYLLEADEEKAKEIFTKYYEAELQTIEKRYTAEKEALTMILKNLQPNRKGNPHGGRI